jgi:di/tricarboxylate transporter
MSLAALSVGALALAVAVSCFTSLNVGLLAIALAWVIGVYVGDMPVNSVMGGFPSSLFLTLAGVTLLFTMAQSNGTLDRLAHRAVRSCRGHRGVVPIMFFLLAGTLASMGPGNIATAALIAPMAMTTAARARIPLFLMAIMVGNGANAGSLSPFAPTGIIVNGLMERIGLPGLEAQTYVTNALAHAFVAFGGYFLFGGWRLFGSASRRTVVDAAAAAPLEVFETRHWTTLGMIGALILSVLFFDVNVGLGAFLCGVVLVLLGSADDKEAIRRMPWNVIVMVCGVTVLIAVLEKAQGVDLLVSLVARLSTRDTVTGVVAFLTGLISVYSSTSGVVLPAFLPMVPGLAQELGGASPLAIAASMNIGGHLVDISPLSTIGALCVASAPVEDGRILFNKLLAWGLSMSVVGGAVCYLFFGRGLW